MPFYGELIVGLVIAIGLVGIVVPVVPGTLMIVVAIGVWAAVVGGWAWLVFGVAAALICCGEAVKYLAAGRVLRRHEIPTVTIVVGGLVGIVGFFVVPLSDYSSGSSAGRWYANSSAPAHWPPHGAAPARQPPRPPTPWGSSYARRCSRQDPGRRARLPCETVTYGVVDPAGNPRAL